MARLYLGTAVSLEVDRLLAELAGAPPEPRDGVPSEPQDGAGAAGNLSDVGAVVAFLDRQPEGGVLAHPGPSAGVVHLLDGDLSLFIERALSEREHSQGFGYARRFGGTVYTEPLGRGLPVQNVPAGVGLQVAAGMAFGMARGGGGSVVALQPEGSTMSGAWHEALAFAAAAHSPLVVLFNPVTARTLGSGTLNGAANTLGRGVSTDPEGIARAYGVGLEKAKSDPISVYGITLAAMERASAERRPVMVRLTEDEPAPDGELARLRELDAYATPPDGDRPDWAALEHGAKEAARVAARDVVERAA